MGVHAIDGSSVCLVVQSLLCMYYTLHFFKMQDQLGSSEEVFLHGAGCSTAHPLCGEKADCSIPQRISACSLGQSFRAQSKAGRGNQHGSQPEKNKLQTFEQSKEVLSGVSRFLFSPKMTEGRKAS